MKNNVRNGHKLEFYVNHLSYIGKVAWKLRIIDIFPDCDGSEFVFNKYNPLSYILALILILGIFFVDGYTEVKKCYIKNKFWFSLSDFWKSNLDKVEFIPRNKSERDKL